MPYFLPSDKNPIYYEDNGQGQPIIFVHGWGFNRNYWGFQRKGLRDRYRVITYDLRGHGVSSHDNTEYGLTIHKLAEDLHELIEHLKFEDVILVGWAMGASILYDYVRTYGFEYVKKLCFVDMSPKVLCDDEWKLGLREDNYQVDNLKFASLAATDWDAAAKQFVSGMFANGETKDEARLDWALRNAQQNTPHVMTNLILSLAVNDYRDVVPKLVDFPVLFVHGENSMYYGTPHGEWLHEQVPTSDYVVIPDAGHAVIIEQPEAFNKALVEFIEK